MSDGKANLDVKLDDAALEGVQGAGPSWQMVDGIMQYGERTASSGPGGSLSSHGEFSTRRNGEDGTSYAWSKQKGHEVPAGRWRR